MSKFLDFIQALLERRDAWLTYAYHREQLMEDMLRPVPGNPVELERAACAAYREYERAARQLNSVTGGRLFGKYRTA